MQTPIDIYEWTSSWALDSGLKLWRLPETDSTNTTAKDDTDPTTRPELAMGAQVSAPSLYLTRLQVRGRGRGTNVWQAPTGSALFHSWSFQVARVPQPVLSPLVGLALFRAAKGAWPDVELNLKAPNDLYIGRAKVAGILIEIVDQGPNKRVVIGIGMNVMSHPADVATATSLARYRVPSHQEWAAFMTSLREGLERAVREGLGGSLSEPAREDLKQALNLHPLYNEPIEHVDELGQLHRASGIIRWHEL